MGNAGRYAFSPLAYFHHALERGRYHEALPRAFEVPRLSLKDALLLTILAARHDQDRYERMAQRWLVRFISEKRPTLGLIQYVASDLDRLGLNEPPGCDEDAEARLRKVAEKLEP